MCSKSAESCRLWECGYFHYLRFGGLPCCLIGITLSLVVAFLDQCTCHCSSSCESYKFRALLPDSPHASYILQPGGKLVIEENVNNKEEKEGEREEYGDKNCAKEAMGVDNDIDKHCC